MTQGQSFNSTKPYMFVLRMERDLHTTNNSTETILITAILTGNYAKPDPTLISHLDICDVKAPQNHNEHGENFEKYFFHPFFLKILVPIVTETR